MHYELVMIMINRERIYACVENFDKIRTIKCIRLRIVIYKVIPVALSNLIQKYMAISINIIQDPRKVFFSKHRGCHASNLVEMCRRKGLGNSNLPQNSRGKIPSTDWSE